MTKKKKEALTAIEEILKKAADRIQMPDWESRREELMKRIREAEENKEQYEIDGTLLF